MIHAELPQDKFTIVNSQGYLAGPVFDTQEEADKHVRFIALMQDSFFRVSPTKNLKQVMSVFGKLEWVDTSCWS